MSERRVRRWIRGFGADDRLTSEFELPATWRLAELQVLFERPSDDPMYECYPIGAHQAAALGPGVGHSLVSDELTWFLEADVV